MPIREIGTGSEAERSVRNVAVNMGGTAEAFFRPIGGMKEASFFIPRAVINYRGIALMRHRREFVRYADVTQRKSLFVVQRHADWNLCAV